MMFQRISKGRKCPVCNSADVYRVRRAGLSVKLVCKFLNLRPHWCPDCDTFFLGPRHTKDVRIGETLSSPGSPRQGGSQQAGSVPH